MGDSHWSNHIAEATLLARLPDRSLHLSIYGCSDNGQFCLVSPRINHGRIVYREGSKLNPHDIILEVHGYKVSGYTQSDLEDLIQTLSANCEPIIIKTVPGGLLTTSLKEYLSLSFKPESLDHELQRVIRDNVYLRVVPCTTRKPRAGEVNGVDYQFLTIEQFVELEKSDGLLESGMFEGNYYGTPKPSNKLQPNIIQNSTDSQNISLDQSQTDQIILNVDPDFPDDIDLGPLPDNWEIACTDDGHQYFIDHNNGTTQWNDPRIPEDDFLPENYPDLEALNLDEPMPPGWEKVYDPKYGVFYIDHNNKRTQYEPPQMDQQQRSGAYSSNVEFTNDPSRLVGPLVRTTLIKSPYGFGFTIIGGSDRARPEFLQIKHIMPGGPAALDGSLETGDVLVYVDSTLVLGFLHADIVQLFQNIQVGQQVVLTVSKGYSLPFDLEDPRARVVTTMAVANGNSGSSTVNNSVNNNNNSEGGSISSVKSSLSAGAGSSSNNEPAAAVVSGSSSSGGPGLVSSHNSNVNAKFFAKNSQPEFIKVNIVKSSTGFGFTVSDNARGQRVKQINDASRCGRLREGDILVEINKQRVKERHHHEVVQILKDIPEGEEVTLLVQRGSISAQSSNSSGYSSAKAASIPINQNTISGLQQLPPKMSTLTSTGVSHIQQSIPTSISSSTLSQSMLQSRDVIDKQFLSDIAVSKYLYQQQQQQQQQQNSESGGSTGSGGAVSIGVAAANAGVGGSQKSRSRTPGPDPFNNRRTGDIFPEGTTNYYYNDSTAPGDFSSVPRRPKTPTAADIRGSSNNNAATEQFMWVPNIASTSLDAATPNYIPASVFLAATNSRNQSNVAVSHPSNGNANDILTNNPAPMYGSLSRYRKNISYVPSNVVGKSAMGVGGTHHLSDDSSEEAAATSVPPVFFTTLHKSNNGFGFRILGGAEDNTKITIGPLVPDGAALRSGQIFEGDELVSVNGNGVVGADHQKVVELVEAAARLGSVTLGLRRDDLTVLGIGGGNRRSPFDVVLTRSENEGFGFVIVSSVTRSGRHMGEFIGKLIEKSPAERCGMLKVGDRILAVNGVPVTKLKHEKIVLFIKNCGRTVTLRICPVEDSHSMVPGAMALFGNGGGGGKDDEEFDVVLVRGNHGYGFSIRGGGKNMGGRCGLYVLRLQEGGPADRDGRLKVGDELVSVNGRPTMGMGHFDAVEAIRAGSGCGLDNGSGLLRLRVRRRRRRILTSRNQHQQARGSIDDAGRRGPKLPPRLDSGAATSSNRPSLPPNYSTAAQSSTSMSSRRIHSK